MIKTVATVSGVEKKLTKTGSPMAIVTADGKTYTTFEQPIIDKAEGATGRTAVIGYEEKRNGQYTNRHIKHFVVQDGNEPAGSSGDASATTVGQDRAVGNSGQVNGDWSTLVAAAATAGDWRAADALQRRLDINKSVALNNSIKFLEFLNKEDRTPSNIKLIYESLLTILAD